MGQDFQARYVQDDESLDYTPSSAVTGGSVIVVGTDLGFAKNDIAANELGALFDEGVFDLVKDSGAINDRELVYWHAAGNPVGGTAGTGAANTTSGSGVLAGKCVKAALAGDAVVRVKKIHVTSVTNTIQTLLQNPIADPGDAGAIPVTDSGRCPIVTTTIGGETRTLAAPTILGQLLSIQMKTDGGDCVITCATGINQAGNTHITLNDAGDCILLEAIEVGATMRWRVLRNDGCTLAA